MNMLNRSHKVPFRFFIMIVIYERFSKLFYFAYSFFRFYVFVPVYCTTGSALGIVKKEFIPSIPSNHSKLSSLFSNIFFRTGHRKIQQEKVIMFFCREEKI